VTDLQFRLGLLLAPLAALACLAVPWRGPAPLGEWSPVSWNPNGVHAWARECWWTPPVVLDE